MSEANPEPLVPVLDSSKPTPPVQVVLQQSSGNVLLRLFSFVGWAGFGFCSLLVLGQWAALGDYFDATEGITEKFESGAKFGSDKVAIIDVTGVIMDGEGFVKRQIKRIREDDDVKAVVVRVDSPGGTVTASDYIYHHLQKLRQERNLPMVVSMGGMATSGGYYVSMAVGETPNTIFAEPTTTTGSIGVIISHYDVSGLLARFDVKDDSISSHPRKQMLSMTRPIPDEHRELLQGYVNESFSRFKEIVQQGRPALLAAPDRLNELATGEIFTAQKALEHGLVDKIGFLEDAVARAIELAGLDASKTRVVKYEPPVTLFDLSPLALGRASELSEARALLELAAPRAYYLTTALPPFLTTVARQ